MLNIRIKNWIKKESKHSISSDLDFNSPKIVRPISTLFFKK